MKRIESDTSVPTAPGIFGILCVPPPMPTANTRWFTTNERDPAFVRSISTVHFFVSGSWLAFVTVDDVHTSNSRAWA